jgi:hypothetical protein
MGWQSGIGGVKVRRQADRIINKVVEKMTLSEALAVTDWPEIRGPDSLKLR